MAQAKSCSDCGKGLSRQNRTGLCRACCARAIMRREGQQERMVAARTLALRSDPLALDAARARMAAARTARDIDGMRERFVARKVWLQGQCAQPAGSPSRVKAGQRASATKLAWCPPHLRAEYRFLTQRKAIPAAEARDLIERHYAAEMARWTRECLEGVVPERRATKGRKVAA